MVGHALQIQYHIKFIRDRDRKHMVKETVKMFIKDKSG